MVSPYSYVGMKNVMIPKHGLSPEQQNKSALDILTTVCNFYNVPEKKILSKERYEPYCTIRHICMYLVRNKTNMSVVRIGKIFNRDHTSILAALRKIEGQINAKFDNDIKTDIERLKMIV